MSAGTAPSMLSRRNLVAALRLFADSVYHEFPVTQLFGTPKVYEETNFVLDLIEELRTLGTTWHSGPHAGDPVELEKWTRKVFSALYKSVAWPIPPGYFNTVRDVDAGESDLIPVNEMGKRAAERKSEALARAVQVRFRYLMRMWEKLCIDTLTQTTFNVTVDGATQAINFWNLQKDTATVSWATHTTDIAADWAHVVEAAEAQFGGPIAKVVTNASFFKNYIAINDNWHAFIKQNPEWVEKGFGADYMMARESSQYEVLKVRGQTGAVGSLSAIWPDDCVVLLGPNYQAALRNCTVACEDNDFNGGLYSYTFDEFNPKRTTLVAGNNGLPAIIDWTQVYCYDVTP